MRFAAVREEILHHPHWRKISKASADVYMEMATFADCGQGEVYVPADEFAERLQYTLRCVRLALAQLVALGFATLVKKGRKGRASTYAILATVRVTDELLSQNTVNAPSLNAGSLNDNSLNAPSDNRNARSDSVRQRSPYHRTPDENKEKGLTPLTPDGVSPGASAVASSPSSPAESIRKDAKGTASPSSTAKRIRKDATAVKGAGKAKAAPLTPAERQWMAKQWQRLSVYLRAGAPGMRLAMAFEHDTATPRDEKIRQLRAEENPAHSWTGTAPEQWSTAQLCRWWIVEVAKVRQAAGLAITIPTDADWKRLPVMLDRLAERGPVHDLLSIFTNQWDVLATVTFGEAKAPAEALDLFTPAKAFITDKAEFLRNNPISSEEIAHV